ncbi:uncharacterized protein LOC129089269 isoform X1 [Anoplopoma fimbria]|uniref:uncharacterized protein LOC129089269 isoform X1 n=1 Tax=Anoplopoma fimbria TaxID=229290 RepID=UPI0023EDCF38|nr:uncharacterized protein LOC129089269 isoform X1 [Anoplopoma fimbria]
MDKSVLLVLFCLQVFLLITAFTSADAATLGVDDRRQQSPNRPNPTKGGSLVELKERGRPDERRFPGCLRKDGGCSIFGKVKPKDQPTPNPKLLSLVQKMKEIQQLLSEN